MNIKPSSSNLKTLFASLFLACATFSSVATAQVRIEPLTKVYSSETTSGELKIENSGDEAILTKLTVYEISHDKNGKKVEKQSTDIAFKKQIVALKPGELLALPYTRKKIPSAEKAYQIVFEQVKAEKVGELAVKLEVNWMWFFREEGAKDALSAKVDGNVLKVKNTGNATARLLDFGSGESTFKNGLIDYVFPGQTIDLEIPTGATIGSTVKFGTVEVPVSK